MVRYKNLLGLTAPNTLGFTMENYFRGPLRMVHGMSFGASWAECVLGPDIAAPGGIVTTNQPSVSGEGWDLPWNTPPVRPGHVFIQDQLTWRRGHLINGEWGGRGDNWDNLTPLTSQANSWHTGVENAMRSFLAASYSYDINGAYKNNWYGIHYRVVRSVYPFADPANQANLYSYAPSHINVCWRAIQLPKIHNNSLAQIVANAVANYVQAAILPPAFPNFNVYNAPQALQNHQSVDPLVAAAQPWAANANGFDDSIQIHNAP